MTLSPQKLATTFAQVQQDPEFDPELGTRSFATSVLLALMNRGSREAVFQEECEVGDLKIHAKVENGVAEIQLSRGKAVLRVKNCNIEAVNTIDANRIATGMLRIL